jgi:hypothetical protein
MLETPPEVRRKRRMRILFLGGVKRGEVFDIPSAAIAPLDVDRTSGPPPVEEPSVALVQPVLAKGVEVWLVDDKSGLIWEVRGIRDDGLLDISTTIFGCRRDQTVETGRVEVVPQKRSVSQGSLHVVEDARAQAPPTGAEWVAQNLRPIRPTRVLDRVIDSLVFTDPCLLYLSRRFYRGTSVETAGELVRAELRKDGLLESSRAQPCGYGRIRVPDRFLIRLPRSFELGVAAEITRVEVLKKRQVNKEAA